jgi:hypothetical protein
VCSAAKIPFGTELLKKKPIQYLIKVCCAQFRILMDSQRFLSAGCGFMRAKMIHKKEKSEEIACFKVLDVLV